MITVACRKKKKVGQPNAFSTIMRPREPHSCRQVVCKVFGYLKREADAILTYITAPPAFVHVGHNLSHSRKKTCKPL